MHLYFWVCFSHPSSLLVFLFATYLTFELYKMLSCPQACDKSLFGRPWVLGWLWTYWLNSYSFPGPKHGDATQLFFDMLRWDNITKVVLHLFAFPGPFCSGSCHPVSESVSGTCSASKPVLTDAMCGATAESFPLPALAKINYTYCFPPHLSSCLEQW